MDLFDLSEVLIYYILSFYISDPNDLVILSNVNKEAYQHSINARTALFSSIGSLMFENHKGKFPELMGLLTDAMDIPFPAPNYVYSPRIFDKIMREYLKRIANGAAFKGYVQYLTEGKKSIAHINEILVEVKRNHPMAIIDTNIAYLYKYILCSLVERHDYSAVIVDVFDEFISHLLDVMIELPKPILLILFIVIEGVFCSLNEACAWTSGLPFISVHGLFPTVVMMLSIGIIFFMVSLLKAIS